MTDTKQSKELVTTAKKNGITANSNFKQAKSSDITNFLTMYRGAIAQALPKHLTPEKIIMIVTNLMTKNPKLKECSASSLIGAVLQSSLLGFEPIESLGLCYYVPYGGEIQFQIGYQGLVQLAMNTGMVNNIWAGVVYEDDYLEWELGLYPKLVHRPSNSAKKDNDITFAYACAEHKNGSRSFSILSKEQIENRRKRSPSQKNGKAGAWLTDYPEMAKAKAVKSLAKYLPKTVELAEALSADEGFIRFNTDTEATERLTKSFDIPDIELAPEKALPEVTETKPIAQEKPKPEPKVEPKTESKPEPKAELKPSQLTPEEMAEYGIVEEHLQFRESE